MARLFDRAGLDAAVDVVRGVVPPTPQYAWPLLAEELGCPVWIKHENHTPTGAFKIRGGLVLLDRLARRNDPVAGLVSATRGNHGQSLALAGRRHGIPVTVVVPETNSVEKNAAMRGFGADLRVHGRDFDRAREHAAALADQDGLLPVTPFDPDLVRGVATYALELFTAAGDLDAVYVPIGLGSGICGLLTVRDLLGLRTRIIGVVAPGAPAYAHSFATGHEVSTAEADTFVDGVACRTPDPRALQIILAGADQIVQVTDTQTAEAMRLLYRCTHNLRTRRRDRAGRAGPTAPPPP